MCFRTNKRLQRTGGKRRFAALCFCQRFVVVLPPPRLGVLGRPEIGYPGAETDFLDHQGRIT